MTDTIIDRLTSHLELPATPENFDLLLLDVKDAKDELTVSQTIIANLEEEKASLQKALDAKPSSNGWGQTTDPTPVNNSEAIINTLNAAKERLGVNALSNAGDYIDEAIKIAKG
jgi:hypothetical protein